MAKRVGVDKWLFGVVLLLVLFGLVMVFSASAVMAQASLGSPYSYVGRQAIWAVLGLVAMVLLMQVDYRRYNNPRVVFPAVAVTMLLLIGVFAVSGSHNTHRWVRFGDLFTALILKEPDLGTGMVCMAVTALMLYLAGARTRYFAVGAAFAAPVLYFMLFHVAFRRARMLAFVNPEADPKGTGFHILQSLIAVGTGGIRGLGLMEGRQKLFYLPEVQTDFIFANICEELGLIGALLIVGLFVALGYRGLRAAFLSTDPFARFLAFGITTAILIQAFFNMSVVLALLPTKGIPLPFISSGGTSIFITLAGMGVLLNITREID